MKIKFFHESLKQMSLIMFLILGGNSMVYAADSYTLWVDCSHSAAEREGTIQDGLAFYLWFDTSYYGLNKFGWMLPDTSPTNDACKSAGTDPSGGKGFIQVWSGLASIGSRAGLLKESNVGNAVKIRFVTYSDNAFMIDRMRLFHGTRLVQYWGKNEGRAWCLSTDANDGNKGWAELVSGCHSMVDFHITPGSTKGTSVYAPTDAPFAD